jgi:hypothetical protein
MIIETLIVCGTIYLLLANTFRALSLWITEKTQELEIRNDKDSRGL